jgi:hypothetical protein
MTTYKLLKFEGKECGVLRNGADSIPLDEANTDYQAYLKWVAEGNTPLPAENE